MRAQFEFIKGFTTRGKHISSCGPSQNQQGVLFEISAKNTIQVDGETLSRA